ncbi:MAG: insulinase family protein, partial [Syntrophobacterales bacterium]|nr:insulinase family protein [Syntrophobacterales bacterium]
MLQSPCPQSVFTEGEKFGGFEIKRVTPLPDIRQTAYEMIHLETKADVLHLHNDDPENVYAICFRTPPHDSTGLPHILEHSVLAGSKRYPLKDVFNELHRGSLQTFINAFTYPDKTVYPVASQVKKDFFNLAQVYTDLVLRPRLLKETFQQEGYHFAWSDENNLNSSLAISGIVYNEMKGAYSSPDSLMFKAIQENLYPDTVYRNDSGGSPEVIPDLTYEQFLAFHRAYYSPSNARFFFYGNISPQECLSFLDEALQGFEAIAVESRIADQPRWNAPRRVAGEYPVNPEEETQPSKAVVNIAWMLADNLDYETVILLEIVSWALVGSNAGPLKKALLESALGEDLSPVTGLEKDLKQLAFMVGLRGTDAGRAEAIESLIIDTLSQIADSGFDQDLIEGALHQVEFQAKEIHRGVYPYGITLMGHVLHTWLYDGDPLAGLNFSQIIANIRTRWNKEPDLFQKILRQWFCDNPHRLMSVMTPSAAYQQEREARENKFLQDIAVNMSWEEREKIAAEALRLQSFQAASDPPEVLALIPAVGIHDLSRELDMIPVTADSREDVVLLTHELFTNDSAYLHLTFDISHIADEWQPYLPLLCRFMVKLGAGKHDYDEMAKRIALKTGGISASLASGYNIETGKVWQKLIVHIRMLSRNISEAIQILDHILFQGKLTELSKIKDLVFEGKNNLYAAVVPSGHIFAKRTAASSLSLAAYREDQWHGRRQLQFLAGLTDNWDAKRDDFIARIADLKEQILCRNNLLLNFTADDRSLPVLLEETDALAARMGRTAFMPVETPLPVFSGHVGISIPAQVSYVAHSFPAPIYGNPLSAPLFVLSRLLSDGFL